jgi:hypothetical protein
VKGALPALLHSEIEFVLMATVRSFVCFVEIFNMDPMHHNPATPDGGCGDLNDLSQPQSCSARKHMASSVVRAPDAASFQDALKAVVNAGLNLRACDSTKRTLEIQGPIDANTLDVLVNQCGCTVTPKQGRSPGERVTCAIPEEGTGRDPIMTTMALGEEGQGWPPHMTTQAIPEEGFGRQPNPFTDAVPEEGLGRDDDSPVYTTQALGEEGQAHP